MLYYLTDSLIVEDNHPDYQQVLQAIKRLALSVAESNHLMLGDYDVLERAREWFRNDDELSPLFSLLVENFPTQNVPSFITYYLEIVLDDPVIRTEAGKTIAQIQPKQICRLENVTVASLIVEDLNDASFYRHIMDWYIRVNNLSANFNYNSIHGGGGRIVEVIKEELRKKHVSLSIVDTDKRYPSYDINKKAVYKDCKKLGRKAPYYKFLPLEVHEIENLIPINYIDMLPDWQLETLAVRRTAFEFLRVKADSILPYFDIKRGIRKDKIINDGEYLGFAEQCYKLNPELLAEEPDFKVYLDSKAEKDIVYYGLIEGVMKKVLELIMSPELPEPELYKFQLDNWNMIAENMVNWFVARNYEALY